MIFGRLLVRNLATKCDVLQVLRERGLVQQVSQPEKLLSEKLSNGDKIKLYCGADPTAKSLHLGNLLPLMVLLNFYVRGHDVVSLIGGATGKVGDPSGRKTERDVIAEAKRQGNIERIVEQYKTFFTNGLKYYESRIKERDAPGKVTYLNNISWWQDVKMLDFLATYGKHIRIQNMLSRDSVSSRLQSQDGIGFNEFTYQILQAYDFYHLYSNEQVSIQVGGNDQWGNITAGIDLINRISPQHVKTRPAFGLTVPLLTTSTGEKFGKSAGNAVFIDPEINTSYDMYQFFVNTTDADVAKQLKIFTLLPLELIEDIMAQHALSPNERYAQKRLAKEVVDLIHGIGKGDDAEFVSRILFGGSGFENVKAAELIRVFDENRILNKIPINTPLSDIVCQLIDCSKTESRRRIKQGSIYLGPNKNKVVDDTTNFSPFLIDERVLLLRVGKQKCYVIECI
ncbi:tyrosine--tRNA ligase MSY1 [Kluyveromyces lactis]|uniref:Tyrosine--tRNA ligase n=1 Tax=Kluyveromyces lactis (strain ATCC 8585 / CBS 2359 / DSM 70799 / NBRC 1267 / NRRL Y-1140 / WM37) TaxID=284590 RepID=Q6CLZ5_KLULA|nr:uncharacterized protein KLLA0_E24267g [Kluyveromyces lactis]CAH00131.1 KLLA0E24267p [Kluyveromyces lactis]|eukprot:XP_455044.1 uncharacterized protein KLLA0_E24267g [Kluyveromyces lactis]